MATHKITDTQIAVFIVPKRLRWPESDTSAAWTKAHACVDALQDLVRSVDLTCAEAEQDHELSASAIPHRRAEICDRALKRLLNFRSFEIAEKALTESIDALEKLSARNPQQAQMRKNLTQALHELREGIEATRRMVLDRCRMREGVLLNNWR